MSSSVFLALHLLVLHTVDGHEVTINPEQVTSLQVRRSEQSKNIVDSVRCLVGLTDGKFVSVTETCDVVKQLLEDTK